MKQAELCKAEIRLLFSAQGFMRERARANGYVRLAWIMILRQPKRMQEVYAIVFGP